MSYTEVKENPLGRGERVHFDFDSGAVLPADEQEQDQYQAPAPASAAFVGDILERASSTTNPPPAPTFKANATGFPAHKKREKRVSAFKEQRTRKNEASGTSQAPSAHNAKPTSAGATSAHAGDVDLTERQRIDQENNERLAAMSEQEIEQERNELLAALSPSLVQRLLARGNIDEGSNEKDWDVEEKAAPAPPTDEAEAPTPKKSQNPKKVSFAVDEGDAPESEEIPTTATQHPEHNHETDLSLANPTEGSVHFPRPPQPPDLDPNSPSFLEDLHKKYYPDLSYDPSALSWMKPIDPSDTTSPYHPAQTALNASELRFDFRGALLAPSKAREIAVTKGLHHHSDAPEAAGYTIPELARLARSAVAAQRCVAYQTLGRVLYRLGKGEFGIELDNSRDVDGPVQIAKDPNQEEEQEVAEDDEAGSYMAGGLWNCIEEGKVIETLTEEAAKETGHLTARTFAQEALWNWRRGGGRKRKAV